MKRDRIKHSAGDPVYPFAKVSRKRVQLTEMLGGQCNRWPSAMGSHGVKPIRMVIYLIARFKNWARQAWQQLQQARVLKWAEPMRYSSGVGLLQDMTCNPTELILENAVAHHRKMCVCR
jgi:hypothetical protein